MLKKIKEFYSNNRVYCILMAISILCIISICTGVILYFVGQTNKDKYGNRLSGIENVEFKKDDIKVIKDGFLSNEIVDDVVINLKGKLIYVNVILNNGKHSDSESLVQSSLELFSDDVKGYYDIQFIVDNEDTEENDNFPVMGYLKSGNSTVKWTNYTE